MCAKEFMRLKNCYLVSNLIQSKEVELADQLAQAASKKG
jgi:hypothetical protein